MARARSASPNGRARTPRKSVDVQDFEGELFEACDRLRGSVESSEYKHLVLGLIFLKYISDSFERRRQALVVETSSEGSDLYTLDEEERGLILEDRDEYLAVNAFWVPEVARWESLLAAASLPDIGVRLDRALEAVEKQNTEGLRSVLPRIYARSPLPPEKLGELVTTIAKIGFGDDEERARDILGRTYEYFIKTFAKKEGHRGGEFFTPASVTKLIVDMLEPYSGRVLDPACGSGGLFVQSAKFVQAHGGRPAEISLFGQENILTTWRIGKINMAIHGLSGNIKLGDSLLDDKHPGLRADFVMANPPFNQKKWGAAQVSHDVRWKYGTPPDQNANYAWIQHFVHHLAAKGRAGFVMANGSLSATTNGEGAIREAIVEANLVDCIVALPGQLFFTSQIPVCVWLLDRDKASRTTERARETLFIDTRAMGHPISRTQIEFSDEDIERVAGIYRSWRRSDDAYSDIPGFCRAASVSEIGLHRYDLNPGRYVGASTAEAGSPPEALLDGLLDQLGSALDERDTAVRGVRSAIQAIKVSRATLP